MCILKSWTAFPTVSCYWRSMRPNLQELPWQPQVQVQGVWLLPVWWQAGPWQATHVWWMRSSVSYLLPQPTTRRNTWRWRMVRYVVSGFLQKKKNSVFITGSGFYIWNISVLRSMYMFFLPAGQWYFLCQWPRFFFCWRRTSEKFKKIWRIIYSTSLLNKWTQFRNLKHALDVYADIIKTF